MIRARRAIARVAGRGLTRKSKQTKGHTVSTQHAKLTANNLRDAATFILEQAEMIEALEREQRAISRLRDALADIATTSTDQSSRDKAKAGLRPGIMQPAPLLVPVPLAPVELTQAELLLEAASRAHSGGLNAPRSNTPVAYDE